MRESIAVENRTAVARALSAFEGQELVRAFNREEYETGEHVVVSERGVEEEKLTVEQ